MKSVIRVLFLGGGKRFSVAQRLIESGEQLDIKIDIFSYEIGFQHPISDIATIVPGKLFSDPDVKSHIEFILKEYAIDIVLPFHDKSISIVSSLSHLIFTPTCSGELVKIFDSKRESAVFFRRNNIPVPSYSEKVPVIAKPDFGSGSQGLLRFTEQKLLDDFLESDESKNFEIQELVSGPEYSVDGYIALNSEFNHFAVRERLEVLGGEVSKSKTVEIPEIEAYCRQLSKIAGVKGAITIQFIYDDKTKRYGIMEVNARYGGGILTSYGAGVPWFKILLRDFLNLKQEKVVQKNNVLMIRSFREHYFELQ
jgi:carbamoyl-phosphate synthase large subunit